MTIAQNGGKVLSGYVDNFFFLLIFVSVLKIYNLKDYFF